MCGVYVCVCVYVCVMHAWVCTYKRVLENVSASVPSLRCMCKQRTDCTFSLPFTLVASIC